MNEAEIDVLYFLNVADETSIPLEIADKVADTEISVTVCSFYSPDSETFDTHVTSLDGRSHSDVSAYKRLYNLITDIRPDILHVHPNATGAIVRAIGKIAGVPAIVSTEHNTHTDFGRHKNAVNGGTNWLNDVLVCNSQGTADSLSRWEDVILEVTGTEKTVIYNGVNIESIQRTVTDRTVDLPDGFLVGTAGRLVEQKNLSTLVTAFSNFVHERTDAQLIIVGDGPRRDDLEELARTYNIEERTHFLGYLSERKDVYSIMNQLDVFAFPSIYEGFGVAVAEAMALGTPVIASDIGVLREVVGDAGLFVNPADTQEFAKTLSRLANDEELYQTLNTDGIQRIKEKFPLTKTVDRHIELYQRLVYKEIGE